MIDDIQQGLAKIFEAQITGLSSSVEEDQIEFRLYDLDRKIAYIEKFGTPDEVRTDTVVFILNDEETENIPVGTYRWELLYHEESNTFPICKDRVKVTERVM